MDPSARLFQVQIAHRELISGMLVDERAALTWLPDGSAMLTPDDLPSSKIIVPSSGRYTTALETKVYDAYHTWRKFWLDHGSLTREALAALDTQKILVPREYSPMWFEPHLFLFYDTVCGLLNFHALDLLIHEGRFANVIEYLDLCNRWVRLLDAGEQPPPIVFTPAWQSDFETLDSRKRNEELAAAIVAKAIGATELSFDEAGTELHRAYQRDTVDFETLHQFFSLHVQTPPYLQNEFWERLRPGFYQRFRMKQLDSGDSRHLTVLAATSYALLADREYIAQLSSSKSSYDEFSWPLYLFRNEYIAHHWAVNGGVSEQALTRAFSLAFPRLANLPIDQLIQLRRAGALRAFRHAVTKHEQSLTAIADELSFSRAALEFEKDVTSELATIHQELSRSAEVAKLQMKRTLLSFSTTVALGAASILFPPLLGLTVLSALYATAVGSASLRDLARARRQLNSARDHLSRDTLAMLLPASGS